MPENDKSVLQVLAQYRRWKEDGEALRSRAQSLLVERFADLVREAQTVQHDLWEDFGQTVKFPINPKFARKGKNRSNVKRVPSVAKPAVTPASTPSPTPSVPVPGKTPQVAAAADTMAAATPTRSPANARRVPTAAPLRAPVQRKADPLDIEKKRRQLRKQIEKAEARLAQVAALGDAVKVQNAEDRLYELNDDLRLLGEIE